MEVFIALSPNRTDIFPPVSKSVNIPKVPLCWERLGLVGGSDRTNRFPTVSKSVNIPKVPLCWEKLG